MIRTLRQAIPYSIDQNVKAQATHSSPLPVVDPRDWQGKTVPDPVTIGLDVCTPETIDTCKKQ